MGQIQYHSTCNIAKAAISIFEIIDFIEDGKKGEKDRNLQLPCLDCKINGTLISLFNLIELLYHELHSF